jgi:S-adenosyl-L-methionine hydrolase (adenosine-forming)
VVHRVIAGLAPGVPVIDVTHLIPRQDVRKGALALWRSAPWLAPGVILAVVDPGVGTSRRAVAVEVRQAGAVLVGPDNGLLLPAAHRLGPITGAVALAHHPVVGATFAGRDLFAPAAAQIATGVDPRALGEVVEAASLVGEPVPDAELLEGRARAEVLWVDRFGNAQLNLEWKDAETLATPMTLEVADSSYVVRCVWAYEDLEPGEIGLVVDSYGLMSISANRESASAITGAVVGDTVWVSQG